MKRGMLVPLDCSPLAEHSLAYVAAIAEPGSEIVLLQVVPKEEPIYELYGQLLVGEGEVRQIEERMARDCLEAAAAKLRRAGLGARVEVAVGDPAEEILRLAEEPGFGLIAMTTHGRGAVGRVVFGSVADRVARHSPVPVLLVRPDAATAPARPVVRRLVVPLDGSALAEAALPVVTDLARRLRLPVHLVRAEDFGVLFPLGDGGVERPTSPLPKDGWRRILAAAEVEAGNVLDAAARRLREAGLTADSALLDGSPFFAIAEATRPGDVIVLTSHGRGGLRRWLLGSVAEKLVRAAPAPVLLVPNPARREAAAPGDEAAMLAALTEPHAARWW